MLAARADIIPEAEIGGFPLRVGAILLAPRLGAHIVLRVVGDRILAAAAERGQRQQTEPSQSP